MKLLKYNHSYHFIKYEKLGVGHFFGHTTSRDDLIFKIFTQAYRGSLRARFDISH